MEYDLWFDGEPVAVEYEALDLLQAQQRAEAAGVTLRVFADLALDGSFAIRGDHRGDRVNVIVHRNSVVRAAWF
jgi:hypothetical protein